MWMSLLENSKSECIWAGRASSYPGQPKQSRTEPERSGAQSEPGAGTRFIGLMAPTVAPP